MNARVLLDSAEFIACNERRLVLAAELDSKDFCLQRAFLQELKKKCTLICSRFQMKVFFSVVFSSGLSGFLALVENNLVMMSIRNTAS